MLPPSNPIRLPIYMDGNLLAKKASELALATKANGIAVQNWTLGSRAAWYARSLSQSLC